MSLCTVFDSILILISSNIEEVLSINPSANVFVFGVLLLLLFNVLSGIRLELMYMSPHCKCQVKAHSSPWFSAACAAAIVHRNHFFRFYQQSKSSESNVKFKQASNGCKRVLEAAKLAYANKSKESITTQKFVLNKDKSVIPPLFNCPEVLSSASDKTKLFAKNFSNNSNVDASGISLLVFPF